MKTDLKKILSVSGESGLFMYISQATNGVILESLVTKKRNMFGLKAKMTSLSDVSIFTTSDEVKLQEVFENMHKILGEDNAPQDKNNPKILKDFFEKALPEYDRDRFYVSHMRKVVDWYTVLKNYASLDFESEKEQTNNDEK